MPIHQSIEIAAPPARVYEVLTQSSLFEEMTGGRKAEISTQPGGEVSLFDGDIQARNIELAPARRVVQAWRAASWPEGVHSIVRFELESEGNGTKLTFSQSGHPKGTQTMLESGWAAMYWEPMQAFLGR